MGIKVRIPGPLRKLTNELDQVEILLPTLES